MTNVVVLDNLVADLLSVKGKDIVAAYSDVENSYGTFASSFTALEGSTHASGLDGLRLLFCETDGTVIFDSAQNGKTVTVDGNSVARNSYASFSKKLVNENHQSRLAILKSLLSASGRAYETKRSTSTGITETYVSIRLGQSTEAGMGTVRISYAQ
jgi:hypothetical protein